MDDTYERAFFVTFDRVFTTFCFGVAVASAIRGATICRAVTTETAFSVTAGFLWRQQLQLGVYEERSTGTCIGTGYIRRACSYGRGQMMISESRGQEGELPMGRLDALVGGGSARTVF